MAIHEGGIGGAILVLDQCPDLRATRVDVASLDQKLLGNLDVGHDDKGGVEGVCLVDRSMLVRPLLELQPQGKPGQIMDAADDRELPWTGELGLGGLLPGREEFLDGGEEETGDGDVE